MFATDLTRADDPSVKARSVVKIYVISLLVVVVVLVALPAYSFPAETVLSFALLVLALAREIMLKRRASKRFVLAETGEEVSWNTTEDNDKVTGAVGSSNSSMAAQQQQGPPVINLETAVPSGSTSASSSFSEDNNGVLSGGGGVGGAGGEGLKVPISNHLHLSVSGGLKLVSFGINSGSGVGGVKKKGLFEVWDRNGKD